MLNTSIKILTFRCPTDDRKSTAPLTLKRPIPTFIVGTSSVKPNKKTFTLQDSILTFRCPAGRSKVALFPDLEASNPDIYRRDFKRQKKERYRIGGPAAPAPGSQPRRGLQPCNKVQLDSGGIFYEGCGKR
jgi:hypothetical protein